MSDINLTLKVNTGRGAADLNAVSKAIKDIDISVTSAGSSFGRISEIFAGAFGAGLALKGLSALESGLQSLSNFVSHSVDEAIQYEDALNQLNVALASSGNYSQEASKDFQDFANSIEETTKFSDDAVVSAGALIAQLTRLSGQALKDATQAALDLSAATGKDLNSAALLVARSASGQTEAFGKLGITIAKSATDAQTFQNVLTQLNQRFGGAAAAQVNTYSGAVALTNNAFKSLQQEVGNVFIKNTALVNVIKAVGTEFGKAAAYVVSNQQSLRVFVAEGVVKAVDALAILTVSLDSVVRFAIILGNIFTAAARTVALGANVILQSFVEIANVLGMLQEKFTGTKNEFAQLTAQMRANSVALATGISDDFDDIADASKNPVIATDTMTTSLANLSVAAQTGLAAVKDGAQSTVEPLNNANAATNTLTESQRILLEQGKQIADQLGTEAAAQQLKSDSLKTAHDAQLVSDQEFRDQQNILIQQDYEQKQLALDNYLASDGASRQKYDAATVALEQKKNDDILKNEKQFQKKRQENLASSLSTIATLQQNAGGELFRIGQAANIAIATVEGYGAVAKAFNAAPPPFNFALAALVGVAVAANIAKIASAKPPGFAAGIDSVPGVGSRDNFPALLAPGERVVPRETNKDLTRFLREGGDGSSSESLMGAILELASRPVVVAIDGREVFYTVNDQLRGGRAFAV